MQQKLEELARAVLEQEPARRPETVWLQQQVDRVTQMEGLCGRLETDRLLFERMYARPPKQNDTVKLRYWRTGRHLPSGREEALRYARALQFSPAEELYFLQACLDRSDRAFGPEDQDCPDYQRRAALMEEMIREYVDQIPVSRMEELDVPYQRLSAHVRHLYCLDAFSATCTVPLEGRWRSTRAASSSYESEFLRQRKLLGEIPRQTMLRHIILLGAPYLNRHLVDQKLQALGYLPLTEGHTTPRGALVDDLIIRFLELYQSVCTGWNPLNCRQWLLDSFRTLDQYLVIRGKDAYQFLYFRVLASMGRGGHSA